MPYICQFEPIPSIVKTGTNFSAFGQCHGALRERVKISMVWS
jgi:hypothetical protein